MKQKNWSPKNEVNKATVNIQSWSSNKILKYGLNDLKDIEKAIKGVIAVCEKTSEVIYTCLKNNGKILTIGAGGSGVSGMSVMREIPQNHRDLDPEKVLYRVEGGEKIFKSYGCEELEDDYDEGRKDINLLNVSSKDVVLLLSASGRTPYIVGAAEESKRRGATTVGIFCHESELMNIVDIPIFLDVGSEIFVGATCRCFEGDVW